MSATLNIVNPAFGRATAMAAAHLNWEALFLNNRDVVFPLIEDPKISIIIVSRGSRHILAMTLNNLSRYNQNENESFEVILVDNASDAETRRLFPRVKNITLICNEENVGFGRACNQGAAAARASRILFLNPDVDLMPGAIQALIDGFLLFERTGIVGARLVFPGGYLQEAGAGFVDDTFVTHPYLRGVEDPSAPEALYAREVGYVSAAVMMIDRALFEAIGGFDSAFEPAYFEDTDLCVRVQRTGRGVVYQPRAIAIHYENATSPSRMTAEALIDKHRVVFLERHRKWLFEAGLHPTGFMARDMNRFRMRVLYIDDQTPHLDLGQGLPRANSIINSMAAMGYLVTLLPVYTDDAEPADRYRDIHPSIEILKPKVDAEYILKLAQKRASYYDVLWISRPHNIDLVCGAMLSEGRDLRDLATSRIIFDTEAIFAARDALNRVMKGEELSSETMTASIANELRFVSRADKVVCVSASEERLLRAAGLINVSVLGHTIEPRLGTRPFQDRNGILFVGALQNFDSPNVDSIDWFIGHVWPTIFSALGSKARLILAGEITHELRARFTRPGVEATGRLATLDSVFDHARVVVAPTRYAGGIPHKVHEAASRGLPTVVTPILKEQLGWANGEGIIVAPWQDSEAFARAVLELHANEELWRATRDKGLSRIEAAHGAAAFRRVIRDICEGEIVA